MHAVDINDEFKFKHIAYIQDMRNELEQEDLIKNINNLASGGLYAYDKVHCDHVISVCNHVILVMVSLMYDHVISA